jgi:hypothetical protein
MNSVPLAQLPLPFLFVHAAKHLNKTTHPATGLARKGTVSKFLSWGESKWHEYAEAPRRSFQGVVYKAGSFLLDRVPITEKQLWRLYTIRQYLQTYHYEHQKENVILEIETGKTLYPFERLLREDLIGHLNAWAAYHRRWSIFSSVLLFPLAVLTILPFGKMVLAWFVFRAVAHWRAFQGAHFLSTALSDPDPLRPGSFMTKSQASLYYPYVKFIINPLIDQHLPVKDSGKDNFRVPLGDEFVGLARDLQLAELVNTLPKATKLLIEAEDREARRIASGKPRRQFSRQNLLDP